MSVYNGEHYLHLAIESVLRQSFPDFEFIIIDDGSTDHSLQILQSYSEIDNRVCVVKKDNTGLADSLRKGLSLSVGKYVARMDHDDVCHPNRLEIQKRYLDQNESIGWCCSLYDCIDENGRIRKRGVGNALTNCELKWLFLWMNVGHHPTAFIRRAILERQKLTYDPGMDGVEDFDLWVRLARVTGLGVIKKTLLQYRIHSNSITQQQASRRKSSKHLTRYVEVLVRSRKQYGLDTHLDVAKELAIMSGQTGINPHYYRYQLHVSELMRVLNDTKKGFLIESNCTEAAIRKQIGLQLLEWARNYVAYRPKESMELVCAAMKEFGGLVFRPRFHFVILLILKNTFVNNQG